MYAPDSPSDLLDELLVPGESQRGEGGAEESDEAGTEGQEAEHVVARLIVDVKVS